MSHSRNQTRPCFTASWATLILCLSGAMLSPGCASINGEVDLESGPPVGVTRHGGVDCPAYAVHVGERAMVHFKCKLGDADYAILHDGTSGEYSDCGPALKGRFMWMYAFSTPSEGDGPTRMTIKAYAQNGMRDRMPMQGELVKSEAPSDEPDRLVAETTFFVRVYQSAVEIDIGPEAEEPAWKWCRLKMQPDQGEPPRVKLATEGSKRRGFRVSGPDEKGIWQVRYEPTVNEVNTKGTTSAEFTLADPSGQTRLIHIDVPTP